MYIKFDHKNLTIVVNLLDWNLWTGYAITNTLLWSDSNNLNMSGNMCSPDMVWPMADLDKSG